MANRAPPRFVPTLTEVVQQPPQPAAAAKAAPVPGAQPPPTQAPSPPAPSADVLAQRVLRRADLVLDRRVREAIATVLLEQTATLAPLLRERLDAVVREVVAQALADELRARAAAAAARTPGA